MATNPVPVSILGTDNQKAPKRAKVSPKSPYKFLQRIDGFGQYARIIFYAETLDEANNILSKLHGAQTFDTFLSHAYHKRKDGRERICVHGIFHLVSRDIDVKYLRTFLPKASISVSYYPEASYPQFLPPKKISEVPQENSKVDYPNHDSFNYMNDSTMCLQEGSIL